MTATTMEGHTSKTGKLGLLSLTALAFASPSKPIGPVYTKADAEAARKRTALGCLSGRRGWRRVVASPRPRRIQPIEILRLLCEAGVTVICAGGGGVPATRDADGKLHGVEAVIDKDLTASLLARELRADALMMLTDVEAVFESWGTPAQRAIRSTDAESLRGMTFAAGSIAPKIAAAIEFSTMTRKPAFIGRMEDAARLVTGKAGTQVVSDGSGLVYR